MPSDAFIGILSGLGEAHRSRQKNIFDQEVDRRSKYEQFLQKASTDPNYRPEAQNQFAELYSTLIQTPYEKKLPKDFERQVTDALTSVEGSMDLQQGGPPEQPMNVGRATPQPLGPPAAPPGQFQGKLPSRIGPDEKFAEAMRLLNAQLQARQGSEIETERAKIAMQPKKPVGAFAFPAGAGIATEDGTIIQPGTAAPEKPPAVRTVTTEQGVYTLNPDGTLGNRLGDRPRPSANAPELSPYGESNILNRISQQWDKVTADVRDLNRANAIMDAGLNAARRGDMNAGSQAVLITFQKFLDPTSVVRESEYARSAEGLAMADRIKGYVDRLMQGGAGVTLPELETFARLAKEINTNLSRESTSLLAKQQERIGRVADRYKIPRDLVFSGYDFSQGGGAPTAPPGGGAGSTTDAIRKRLGLPPKGQ